MKHRPAGLLRRLALGLHRYLHPPGEVRIHPVWQALSWSWRTLRGVHHCLFRQQSPIMLAVEEPVRLSGCGAIAGWAISPTSPIQRIEVYADSELIAAGPPTEHWPEVARRFPGFRWQGPNGFRLAPPVDTLADGRHVLRVRATDSDCHAAELLTTLQVHDYRIADNGDLPDHLRGTNREYQHWIAQYSDSSVGRTFLSDAMSSLVGQECPTYSRQAPIVSIVVPVYRPNLEHLSAAIASVQAQQYENWQLCLCDDGSGQPELTRRLEVWAAADERICYLTHPRNRGIAAATNAAIGLATGEYIAFLDQDDLLAPNALNEIAAAVADGPADLLYSDEDRLDEHGCRIEPIFKPDWSPDLFLSRMYLGHLCVYRREFLERVGGCRSEFDGTQDYDLALRATEQAKRIVHIPKVLYHWRTGGHSAGRAFNRRCHERGRRAIAEALGRRNLAAMVADGPTSCTFHVRYRHTERPLVSILIPTRDNAQLLRRCLRSIRRRTTYQRYEVLIIDNGSREPETQRLLRSCRERVVRLDEPFNHSRLNNLAVEQARGSLILLLNDDTEVITRNWLTAMVEQALRPEVGAVGAWLFHPDGRTQHAGIIVGLGPVATPLHSGILRDGLDRGTAGLMRNVSAVTGACLMMRRQLYEEIGGLDEIQLPTSFNDVDICLRLRRAGYRIVQTPLARLYHHESASRRIGDEKAAVRLMHERWGAMLTDDPFWNPNLPSGMDGSIAKAFHWPEVPTVTYPPVQISARELL